MTAPSTTTGAGMTAPSATTGAGMTAPGATTGAGMTAPGATTGAGMTAPGATAGHAMPAGEGHKEGIKEKVCRSCVARLAQAAPAGMAQLLVAAVLADAGVAASICIQYIHLK